MSLNIKRCVMADILYAANIEAILEEYASESSIKGLPHPQAKMETYFHLESAGVLVAFGAFVDGGLIGFITVLTTMMPHYSLSLSVSESFFVLKDRRKTGAGMRLLRMAEDHARAAGSYGVLISAPYEGVLSAVLPRSGYLPSNTVFFKALRDV